MDAQRGLIARAVGVRLARGESQGAFWQMFGLSQPAASRLECGGKGSPSLIVLLSLYFAGRISDEDLNQARLE
ncbi:hypothetical protein ACIQUF_13835 [Pseudomonas sp. NPDC090233]|uniref:hypothetical protein n=1 Tax=Pseudomonas sp. NPDC090233 TaxID=3364479 RepID=UPI00383B9CDF